MNLRLHQAEWVLLDTDLDEALKNIDAESGSAPVFVQVHLVEDPAEKRRLDNGRGETRIEITYGT